MNTIYRIIWNHAKSEWTVASELAISSHGGKGDAKQNVHVPASMLRRLPWALACVLGGLAVCAPAVHAGDAVASEHQHMEKINARLADLSDLMVKYGNAQPKVVDRVAPSEVATNPSVLPGRGMANVASHASARAGAATRPVAATRSSTHRVVKTAMHAVAASHVVKPSASSKPLAAPRNALSPQLASDAQIAAVMAHRHAQGANTAAVDTSNRASAWVIGNDGSLHVIEAGAVAPKAVAKVAASVSNEAQVAAVAQDAASDASRAATLPAIRVSSTAMTDAPVAGRIAAVDTTVSTDVTATVADARVALSESPEAPAPGTPQTDSTSRLVANVSAPVSGPAASTQTSGLVLETDPKGANLPVTAVGSMPVKTRAVATVDGRKADGDDSSGHGGGSGFQTASVGTPERFAVVDADTDTVDTRPSAMSFSSANLSRQAFSSAALTPMALPPGDSRIPAAPETPTPGLIIGTGGLIGNVGGTLDPVTGALLDPSDPYLESGALKLSKANITTAYSGGVTLTVLGGLSVTVPVSVVDTLSAVGGATVGTGENQHLTLLGGVTSDSYITNINNGATNGGIINSSDPAWSQSCLNVNIAGLLGVDVPCWGVNAAQNNQIIVGDGAYANGSEEVVIGTGASHKLADVDANKAFPGDGDRNSATDPMGLPDDNYQARLGHSVVIGDSATGTQTEQTILGANATSDQANSVALGYGSNADRGALAGYTDAYGLTGTAQTSAGEVAVGNTGHDRQITHVAAGTDDYDAVNVLQLKGAVDSVADMGKLAVKYDDDGTGNPGNTVTLVGDGSGAAVAVTNLAPGAVTSTSTDAVNGSQLNATNTSVANYFGGATNYDGTTNTWTPPDFQITSIHTDGSTTTGDYNNVTDAFSALNTSVVNIYDNGVKYFHANSTGADSTPTGTDSIAVGPAASAGGDNGVAIGNGADASMADSVALGSGSSTTVGAQASYTGYGLTAAQTSNGEVNVGNRQITGVAAGSADGDAVNVAQLRAVDDHVGELGNLAVKYDDDGAGNPTNRITLVGDGTGAPVTITNVASGALTPTSTDAVNGSQLNATNNIIASYLGGTTTYDGTTNTWTPPDFTITNIDASGNTTSGDYSNVSDAFSALDTSLVNVNKRITDNASNLKYFHANTTGAEASATGAESVAMGGDTKAAGAGSVAAGSGAQAQTDGAVAIGQDANADGGQAVAIGSGATASGDGAVSIGDPNSATGDGAVALGKDNTATGDGAVAVGNTSSATGLGAIAMGNTSSAAADGAVAIGNNASVTVAGGVALGEGSVASRNGGGTEAFTNIAVPTVGAISVGDTGQLRQITHVAGGTEDTDAVNVRQLQAVADTIGGVDKLAVKYDADVNGDPTSTVTLVGNGTGPILITNVAPGAITATSLDAINGAQLYDWTQSINNKYSNMNLYKYIQNLQGSGAFAVNDTGNLGNPAASGDNSAAGGAGTVASGTDSTAVGNGATATASNSVALGAGSVADRADTVSVGSAGHERQVVNVAAGTQATDAVNVAQLQAGTHGTVRYDTNKDGSTNYNSVTLGKPGGGGGATVVHNVGAGVADTDAANVGQLADMKSWAQQYSNQQYSDLSRQLNDMGNRAFAGVASAMAMAGLPQAYLPGKSMASIAGSSFHGESSIAIGVSLISDNGRWVYKLNGTDNSRGDAGVSMGVGIQW